MPNNPVNPPLPADLPVNWNIGDTVSPTGVDVGLTQKHGYNYLMQQVNAAQQAANDLGTGFAGLTPASLGAVPTSRLINGYSLANNITLTPGDVGAVPTSRTINGKALSSNINLTPADIGVTAKRTCRFVVGTSTNGWTQDDCDYLCDGVDDQVEIQAAIDATIANNGGTVVLLDGTYEISSTIVIDIRNNLKNSVTLTGSGNTLLHVKSFVPASSDSNYRAVIYVPSYNSYNENAGVTYIYIKRIRFYTDSISTSTTPTNGPCFINAYNLYTCWIEYCIFTGPQGSGPSYMVQGGSLFRCKFGRFCFDTGAYYCDYVVQCEFTGPFTYVISKCTNVYNNSINGAIRGISTFGLNTCTIIGNRISNTGTGISLLSVNYSLVLGNSIYNASSVGIKIGDSNSNSSTKYNTILGNTFHKDSYSTTQYSILLEKGSSPSETTYNLIMGNMIYGKNYTNNAGSTNTFANNKYN